MGWLRMVADELRERFSDVDKLTAGIVALLFGAYGAHKFLLGYKKEGLIMLATTFSGGILALVALCLQWNWLCIVGIAAYIVVQIVSIAEGLIYFSRKEWEFYTTYIMGHRGWF